MMRKWYREILFTLIAFIILSSIFTPNSIFEFIHTAFHHIVVLLLSLVLGLCFSLYTLRSQISTLLAQTKRLNSVIRKPVSEFFIPHIHSQLDIMHKMVALEGIQISKDEMERFVSLCFESSRGTYHGTDSNPPTVFTELYPSFIVDQLSSKRQGNPSNDARFLLVREDELRKDFEKDKETFELFCETHMKGNIQLLQVDPEIAKKNASLHRLPSTDIGVFNWDFVVFFSPDVQSKSIVVRVFPLNREWTGRVRGYLLSLNRVALKIRVDNNSLKIEERESKTKDEERILSKEKRRTWNL